MGDLTSLTREVPCCTTKTFCPIEQILRYHQRDRGGSARGTGLKPSCPCGHHSPVLCTRLAASLDL